MAQCPLCDSDADFQQSGDRSKLGCDTCGTYFLTGTAARLIQQSVPTEERYKLSGLTRGASERGARVTLDSTTVENQITTAPVPRTPLDAIDRLLLLIHGRMPTLTGRVTVRKTDFPLIYARSPMELNDFLGFLANHGYLTFRPEGEGWACNITLQGWYRIEELRAVGEASNQAFVAMWFNSALDPAWKDGIHPALLEAGYFPVRIDLVDHNDKIDDRILVEIRRSGLIVADFTGNRGGVYFEAGFALGLGLPVIWCVREDEINNVHFDTRQYNHVTWNTPAELKEKLYNRVVASLGRPSSRTK
jgi:nucleoside 2-deoxyribosyltransferase